MLLLRGATVVAQDDELAKDVSIHAPLARSNYDEETAFPQILRFNTCSSCEEQPDHRDGPSGLHGVSIHAPLARSNLRRVCFMDNPAVSIHAPLARSNLQFPELPLPHVVSIHAPLARSNAIAGFCGAAEVFQYMLLLRGATFISDIKGSCHAVSIHAPLARSNYKVISVIF